MKITKGTIVKYAITLSLGAALSAVALIARNYTALESAAERYRALSDAFSIPGVVMIMVGIILLIAKDGFFDMITYSLGKFAKSLIPFSRKTDETYYDYKVRKSEERLKGFSCLFVVGALFLILTAVFTILFFTAV